MARPRRTQSWGQASVLITTCNPACLKLSFWVRVSNQLTGMRGQDREGTEPGPGRYLQCSPSARISTGPHWQMEEVGKFASARTEGREGGVVLPPR